MWPLHLHATESRAGLITAFLTVTVFYARALLTGAHHGPHHGSHHRALPETVREGLAFSGPQVTLHPSPEADGLVIIWNLPHVGLNTGSSSMTSHKKLTCFWASRKGVVVVIIAISLGCWEN